MAHGGITIKKLKGQNKVIVVFNLIDPDTHEPQPHDLDDVELRIYQLEDDGTVRILDWAQELNGNAAAFTRASNTQTVQPIAESAPMDGQRFYDDVVTYDEPGIFTRVILTNVFVSGRTYVARVNYGSPATKSTSQVFQTGGADGDAQTDVEALLAVLTGRSVVTDNGNGTRTASFKKPDGVTEKVSATFDALGNRTATSVTHP
jgi:hypothetical protein